MARNKSKEVAVIAHKESEFVEVEQHKPKAMFTATDGQLDPKATEEDIVEQITKSKITFKNWKYPDAEKLFPNQPIMRTVDKYYPMAEGGPLFMDEPMYEDDLQICQKKAEFLKKNGHRYVYLTKTTTIHDVAQQLGIA
jgi:hypothetical protein